jgi:hypothetical protein
MPLRRRQVHRHRPLLPSQRGAGTPSPVHSATGLGVLRCSGVWARHMSLASGFLTVSARRCTATVWAMIVAAAHGRLDRRLVGDCLITASADPVDSGAYQTEHQTLQVGGARCRPSRPLQILRVRWGLIGVAEPFPDLIEHLSG